MFDTLTDIIFYGSRVVYVVFLITGIWGFYDGFKNKILFSNGTNIIALIIGATLFFLNLYYLVPQIFSSNKAFVVSFFAIFFFAGCGGHFFKELEERQKITSVEIEEDTREKEQQQRELESRQRAREIEKQQYREENEKKQKVSDILSKLDDF